MILRRIAQGIKDQDWFVVSIEIMIVVIGIFLGMQVTEWYEERAEHKLETELLGELKKELETAIRITDNRAKSYEQVREAGRISSDFLLSGEPCTDNCWDMLVTLLHASQWQRGENRESTYESMRQQGFPKNRRIVDAVEQYLLESTGNANFLNERPVYRSLVRRHVPWNIQHIYWEKCYDLIDGLDSYVMDCDVDLDVDLVRKIVDDIRTNPEILLTLSEWAGGLATIPDEMFAQNKKAMQAIDLIDAELEARQ